MTNTSKTPHLTVHPGEDSEWESDPAELGHFVDVVAGDYRGLFGAYIKDEDEGKILVRNRDHGNEFPEYVTVRRQDVRASTRTGGR